MDPMFVNELPVPYTDGSFMSPKIGRVVDLIRQYNRRLDVQYIPERAREPGDNAFRIVENGADGQVHVLFMIATEADFDERVLEQIYAMDSEKHGVDTLRARQDAAYQAQRDMKKAAFKDAMEEANDLAVAMIKTQKHNYRHNGITHRL